MIGPVEVPELPFWLAGSLSDAPGMSSPDILERPIDDVLEREGYDWIVTVYDNEYNTYDEVMMILMAATGCSAQEAYIEAWEIDHLGKAVVHNSSEDDCRMAASIISEIGIQVEVSPS
jgi:ATP-dependent Clp protease adaptor protein ClpS